MLIFLAGLAFLLLIFALGDRAAAQVWHGGSHRFLDRCDACERDYARPGGMQRVICPHGHVMSAVVAERHTPHPRGMALAGVCIGFLIVALVLMAAGVVPQP